MHACTCTHTVEIKDPTKKLTVGQMQLDGRMLDQYVQGPVLA